MNIYIKNKYKNDINYRIKSILNARLRDYIKNKFNHTIDYLSCSLDYFKKWIESQFDEKMRWDNLGLYWQFDHIKPCVSYDMSKIEEIYKCYHWSNIRPHNKYENMSKGGKINNKLIDQYYELFQKTCIV